MTLATFLATVAHAETAAASKPLTGDEIAAMIEAEAGPVGSTYQGTFSREDIYVNHD